MLKIAARLGILFIFSLSLAVGQNADSVDNKINKIHLLLNSDESKVFMNLNEVENSVLSTMEKLDDSITYYLCPAELRKRAKESNPVKIFMANRNEPWRATDLVTKDNKTYPERRLFLELKTKTKYYFPTVMAA